MDDEMCSVTGLSHTQTHTYTSSQRSTCASGGPASSLINNKWLWPSTSTSFLYRPPVRNNDSDRQVIQQSDTPRMKPYCAPGFWGVSLNRLTWLNTNLTHTRSHFLDRMCLCLTIRFLDCGVTACDVFVYQRRFATFQTSQNTLREGGRKCSTHKLIQVQPACTFTAPCIKYNSQTKLKCIRHRLSVPPSDKLWFLLGSLDCLLFNLYFPPVDCFVIHIQKCAAVSRWR